MGVKLTKIDELDEYRSKINDIGTLQVGRLTVPWYIPDWTYNLFGNGETEQKLTKEAHAFTGNVIAMKRKEFLANKLKPKVNPTDSEQVEKKQRLAMLDTLLVAEQNQQLIDAAGIQEEVDTFVFEGFDTTMTAITFILFAIANHEEVQQRLYEEISSLDGEQNYNNLTYLDAVIKEGIRTDFRLFSAQRLKVSKWRNVLKKLLLKVFAFIHPFHLSDVFLEKTRLLIASSYPPKHWYTSLFISCIVIPSISLIQKNSIPIDF